MIADLIALMLLFERNSRLGTDSMGIPVRLAAGGDDVRHRSNDLVATATRDSTALSRSRGLIDNGTAGGVSRPTRAELPPSTVPAPHSYGYGEPPPWWIDRSDARAFHEPVPSLWQPEWAAAIRLLLLRMTHTEIEITVESVRDFWSSRCGGSDAA
ncbi:hypothetical protein AB0B89_00300 [Sphaerisporangium sp. NPDC049002]|uniref:hypothetical protein n=1 Tax=Sphaerisporangium sp. NPDC049002 TaxID=3155392 RepID=UPI0033F36087